MNDYKEHVTFRTFSKKEESLQESVKVEVYDKDSITPPKEYGLKKLNRRK